MVRNWRQRHPTQAAVTLSALLTCFLLSSFFAIRLWQDHRLVENAWHTIGQIDAEIATLESNIRRIEDEVQTASKEEKDELFRVRKEMQTSHLLLQYEAVMILRDIQRLSFRSAPKEIAALAHNRLFDTVRLALDSGAPETAHAVTARVLRRNQEGALLFPYSPSEIERLQGLAEEASRASPGLGRKSQ